MVLFGIIALVVSGMTGTCAILMQRRLNPHSALPWLFAKRSPRSTWRANALFGIAGGTGVIGAILLTDMLGYWAVLVIAVPWIVAALIQYQHNRNVTHTPTSSL